jgi:type III pantothenate kinase
MDVNLMVLGLGNSRLSIGVFVAGELAFSTRIAVDDRADWAGKIGDAWARVAGNMGATVAGRSVQWAGKELDLPIGVETKGPRETGVDRVLNIAAAYEQIGGACVVVDAGTAITVDCCNANGDFLGGAIAPGINMMLDALHEKTAKLPRIAFERPSGAVGDSTEAAIRQGVFHAMRGLVREFVENYATEIGGWPEVIATGGDAAALFEGWDVIHAVSPDLTLYGIALAFVEHHLKHD